MNGLTLSLGGLWLGEVRGNLSYHHPHLNPPPSSPEPNMVQGKGEESFLENEVKFRMRILDLMG
jgi:hypothetical protein